MVKVIFSIDDWYSPPKLARFLRHMDTQRALGNLKGEFKVLQGCYKGILEISFSCEQEDFDNYVSGTKWVENQESFLCIQGIDCYLTFKDHFTAEGTWKQVEPDAKGENWTYDPHLNQYFVCDWIV